MKKLTQTIAATVMLAAFSIGNTNAYAVAEPHAVESCDYTTNPAIIKEKQQQMLAIDDNYCSFIFSDDANLESLDPNAYWLMNRMMQTAQNIQTAEDAWAWMLVMNGYIREYNARLGRKIGSVEAATRAIEELIFIYKNGNQQEMNTATYVESILAHYKAMHSYYTIIDNIDDNDDKTIDDAYQRRLYYREFTQWFNINNAANGVMTYYTYGAARYSAMPTDINHTFEKWSNARSAELKIEENLFSPWKWESFSSDAKRVSNKKFDKLLEYYKTRTRANIANEMVQDWPEKDYLLAYEHIDENIEFDKIAEMLQYYEGALFNWREVRKQIALTLPRKQRKAYRQTTKEMHTRLYNDLLKLQRINY